MNWDRMGSAQLVQCWESSMEELDIVLAKAIPTSNDTTLRSGTKILHHKRPHGGRGSTAGTVTSLSLSYRRSIQPMQLIQDIVVMKYHGW
jgi:hypothetical protein